MFHTYQKLTRSPVNPTHLTLTDLCSMEKGRGTDGERELPSSVASGEALPRKKHAEGKNANVGRGVRGVVVWVGGSSLFHLPHLVKNDVD